MLQTSKFSTLMHTILFDTLKSNKNPFWVLRFWSCLTINIGFINKKEKKKRECEQINLRHENRLSAHFLISLFHSLPFFELSTYSTYDTPKYGNIYSQDQTEINIVNYCKNHLMVCHIFNAFFFQSKRK